MYNYDVNSLNEFTYCYRYSQLKSCLQKALKRLTEVNGTNAAKVRSLLKMKHLKTVYRA